jgi:thiol-disulfide isomerase/thioredoxin
MPLAPVTAGIRFIMSLQSRLSRLAAPTRRVRTGLAVLGGLVVALAGLAYAIESRIEVPMHSIIVPDSIGFPTPRRLTFGNPAAPHVMYPSNWKAVDAVAIFDNPTFLQAYLFRYRLGNDEDQFALAKPGSTALTDRDHLDLPHTTGRRAVSFDIPVIERARPSEIRRQLKFQLIYDSGAASVRTMDYREGEIRIDSVSYPIRLVQYNATSPYFVRDTNAAVFIERPGSYDFAIRFRLADDSSVIPSTRTTLAQPFRLGDKKFVVGSIDPLGDSIAIDPYAGSDTAMVRGFISPAWRVSDLNGQEHSLASAHGKVTLLVFWSTTCSYCARIRPVLNKLIEENKSRQFQSISCCLDRNLSEIRAFLAKEPYDGIVTGYDAAMWQLFNSRGSTPTVCVIDGDGVIQYMGGGESSYYIADRIVRTLLGAN